MGEENPTRITDLVVVKMSGRIFTTKEDFTILELSVHICSLPDRESLADLTGGVKFTGGRERGQRGGGGGRGLSVPWSECCANKAGTRPLNQPQRLRPSRGSRTNSHCHRQTTQPLSPRWGPNETMGLMHFGPWLCVETTTDTINCCTRNPEPGPESCPISNLLGSDF